MSYWNKFPEYVSVAEKREKAAKKLKQLQKKQPGIKPVILEGSALARTWWGKSWNQNLERYADYSNRIGRGRSYVRHGAVLDLQIKAGLVTALVQGTQTKPYEVKIAIKAIKPNHWSALKKSSSGQLQSLPDLLAGKLPKELSETFLGPGTGLFPAPKEISFNCSCPDWADMCKHVAATLYGVGARLDEDPTLFFTLREARIDELVTAAIQGKTTELLKKAAKKSSKVIAEADLSELFGIDLAVPPTFIRPTDKSPGQKGPAIPAMAPTLPRTTRKTPLTPIKQVEALIAKHKKGVNAETLAAATGLTKTQIYGLVHRLKVLGSVENQAPGIYVKAPVRRA